MKLKDRSDLSFIEATCIIIGHGIGAGILSVPYLASRNSIGTVVLIILCCAVFNVLLHLIIAELSLNNNGAQFVSCFNAELFSGRFKQLFTVIAFAGIAFSVVANVSAYLTGAAAALEGWLGLNKIAGMLIFYAVCALIVFFGIKLVGICEKYAVAGIIAVVFLLLFAVLKKGELQSLPVGWRGANNALALFGMVSFSLSAVMSTPQVVKGLKGNPKKIRLSISTAILINAAVVLTITMTTLLGAGSGITEDGALVDLAKKMGGWVSVIGYIFTLLALATSFWANTIDVRDIVHEQLKLNLNYSWLVASLPPLLLAILAMSSFVSLSRLASVIMVLTCLGIIIAYNRSRKRVGSSAMVGSFGALPFQLLIVIGSLVATVGALLKVS